MVTIPYFGNFFPTMNLHLSVLLFRRSIVKLNCCLCQSFYDLLCSGMIKTRQPEIITSMVNSSRRKYHDTFANRQLCLVNECKFSANPDWFLSGDPSVVTLSVRNVMRNIWNIIEAVFEKSKALSYLRGSCCEMVVEYQLIGVRR